MPIVWQIAVLHLNQNKTLISGVILKKAPYSFSDLKTGRLSNLFKVIKSYFTSPYKNKQLLITSNGKVFKTSSNKNGRFHIITDSHHQGEVTIMAKGKHLPIVQDYPIIYMNIDNSFDIISDIDDTILLSYTTNFYKRIGTLAFKSPFKRKTIGFTQKMFRYLSEHNPRMFYISKSESNLFGTLTAFIKKNELPKGLLFLTPYLKFWQLFNPKKDKNFKIEAISFLIENSKNKKYILFGDDGQRDIEIYTDIAKKFPERLLKIYIRQTKFKNLLFHNDRIEKLKATGAPVKYFKSDDDPDLSDLILK